MSIKKKNNFEELVNNVSHIHEILQGYAAKSVNQFLTLRNWIFGYYIVEYEQNGEDRAKYGENLIGEMASKLTFKGLKGFSISALKNHRTFYLTYPQISHSVIGLLQNSNIQNNILSDISIKSQSVTGELELPSELLLSKLAYTHFIELIRVDDPLQRLFYEVETIKNNWSVRELKRAIGTSLAFRTTMSTNKDAVIAKIKNLKPVTTAEIIRNPYVLEFLDLEEKSEYNESELEQQILTHLQEFLMELGTGFCFEARQKRITFDNEHYRIDLVFYHKTLKCNILIDLKLREYHYSDAGQMNLYLNYYKENEMIEGDNPPIGIILCSDKKDTLVKYSTAGMDDNLFVSKYLLKLPEKKLLESFIKRELNQ
jgi:predicted nuclease of restriction endonuclease-like (RecB) superfamily